MAAVTTRNVLIGPGKLYYGALGATEPGDALVNTAPPTSSWTYAGATDGGLQLVLDQTVVTVHVDQVADPVASAVSERKTRVKTNLAEATLENLLLALNTGGVTSGSGYRAYAPSAGGEERNFSYRAIIVDGRAPATSAGVNQNRRFVVRKVLSIDSVDATYKKDGAVMVPVTFEGHYVDDSTAPYRVIDQNT